MLKNSQPLTLDGSYGEGGGQILRTALAIAAMTGRCVCIEKIRAGRPKPGLAAQHLTAIRALATICQAEVKGDELGSRTLCFAPTSTAISGDYHIDIAAARQGGSAGAACLVMQSVLIPLSFAIGGSTVCVRGGTHIPWSPPYDYLHDVWVPMAGRFGMAIGISLVRTGWYPAGEGDIRAKIDGMDRSDLIPIDITERGPLHKVTGRAITTKLVAHIGRRMADRVRDGLAFLNVPVHIRLDQTEATSPGAGIFLTAHYKNVVCGFGAIGRRGKPAEAVAQEAVDGLIRHHQSAAALDRHLADQILLPLALAHAPSRFSCAEATRHLETNAWVIERFGLAGIRIERDADQAITVNVMPRSSCMNR